MFLSVRVLFPFPFKSEVKSHHCLLNEHVELCVLKKFFRASTASRIELSHVTLSSLRFR